MDSLLKRYSDDSDVGLEADEGGIQNHPLVSEDVSLFPPKPAESGEMGPWLMIMQTFMAGNPHMHMIINQLLSANATDRIAVRINSNGGSIDEGIRLFNVMDQMFFNRITTIIDSKAYSMGAMMFCQGQERIVHPMSTLMFHNYSTCAIGKAGEITDQMEHMNRMGGQYYDNIIANGWLKSDEYQRMLDGKDYWFNAHDLLMRGTATHLMIGNQTIPRADYLAYYQGETPEYFTPEILDKIQSISAQNQETDAA